MGLTKKCAVTIFVVLSLFTGVAFASEETDRVLGYEAAVADWDNVSASSTEHTEGSEKSTKLVLLKCVKYFLPAVSVKHL